MSDDIYQQLDKNQRKKVKSRSQDGFTVPTNNSQSHIEPVSERDDKPLPDVEGNYTESKDEKLVYTAKPKSIAMEVSLKQQFDRYLFEREEISWDTFIEAAVAHALNSKDCPKITENAAARLAKRKLSSTKRRIQTMSQNFK
jgi:hypothetical protein